MAVNGNKNYKVKKEIDLGKWYLIEIEQILNKGKVGYMVNLPNRPDIYDGKVYYTIRLDGEALHLVVNTDPRSFENVKLFAGDIFYAPADANYKGLTWENLG